MMLVDRYRKDDALQLTCETGILDWSASNSGVVGEFYARNPFLYGPKGDSSLITNGENAKESFSGGHPGQVQCCLNDHATVD